MQVNLYSLTSSRSPQSVSVPGGITPPIRLITSAGLSPIVAIEVDPLAAVSTRVFCWRALGEESPGTGWTYVGATETGPAFVYEQIVHR